MTSLELTRHQRRLVWVWIVLVVGMGIYPPWTNRGGYTAGYAPLFSTGFHSVDFGRLMVEWIVATVVVAGLYIAGPTTRRKTVKSCRGSQAETPTPTTLTMGFTILAMSKL
jgi:hypothetical protein